MPKTKVEVELSTAQEIALMERYGRKCSRETLVKRAIAEALKQQAENVPVFLGKEEYGARVKVEAEAKRLADIEAAKLPPEVEVLISRFRAGEKLVDLEGQEVSALEPSGDNAPEDLPLMAQFNSDDVEWYPIALSEIQPEITWRQRQGSVLTEFDPATHVVDDGEPPDAFERLAEAERDA